MYASHNNFCDDYYGKNGIKTIVFNNSSIFNLQFSICNPIQVTGFAPGFDYPAGGAVEDAVGNDRQTGVGGNKAARVRQ